MISLCLTNYNRTDLLFESFSQILTDPRVSEIVISDDHSTEENYQTVVWYCKEFDKVKVYRNEKNLDCYRNKREAVSRASNPWVILFDSDNIITKSYIDRVCECKWDESQILQPERAEPHFDFTAYSGFVVSKTNVQSKIQEPTFQTMLNAMNYFVNRDKYLQVWDGSVDPVTSDSLYQNYRWLWAGNSIFVVPGLTYTHRVHDGSHYRLNHRRTPRDFHESILNRMR